MHPAAGPCDAIEDIARDFPELLMAIKQVARPPMPFDLLGEDVLIAEIVAEAGQRRSRR